MDRAVSETQGDGVALNSSMGKEFMLDGGITVDKGENAGDSLTREQPTTTQRHPANPRATRMDTAVVNRTGLRDFWAIARERFPTLQYSCMPSNQATGWIIHGSPFPVKDEPWDHDFFTVPSQSSATMASSLTKQQPGDLTRRIRP